LEKTESKRGRVHNLVDDGLLYIGASLQTNDIVIGKVLNLEKTTVLS
jgi:DNA-directed RNA polymerase II subunit RPB2/DNA-directed RNA polymerase-4/5 subunit 2